MNRFKIVLGIRILFITTISIIIMISLLVNEESIIMAQQGPMSGPGVIPIEPENVTNQTLQGYPAEDKNMSTGIQNK
jgi:hypothetical protein